MSMESPTGGPARGRAVYAPPRLVEFGSLTELTLGGSGSFSDNIFFNGSKVPINNPIAPACSAVGVVDSQGPYTGKCQ